MGNLTIYTPDGFVDEVERRREKGVSQSRYIREAVEARMQAEDAGEWEPPTERYTPGVSPDDGE